MAEMQARPELVLYDQTKPGYEAIYTGQPFTEEREQGPARYYDGGDGREVMEWTLTPWMWPEDEEATEPVRERIEAMRKELGPSSEFSEVRRLMLQRALLPFAYLAKHELD